MNQLRLPRRLGAGLLSLSVLLVACSAGAAPSPLPSASAPPDAPVTAPPSDGSNGGTNSGGDGLVVAKPGQLDVHDVQADELAARVDGSTIILSITWTSGVEPCNVLDQVAVAKGAGSYAITLREGHGPEEVVCIAIAETHKTEISIPTDGPGTYRITDSTGGAAPIEVTVG
jgi:hypothetical protein